MIRVRAGYVPLTDAAVLIAAAEQGFAADEGLALDLHREASWANIRDKLVFGLFDAAHMLGPLAIATALGLGRPPAPLTVPFALNRGGCAVTVSVTLAAELAAEGGMPADLASTAAALGRVARRRAAPLTFGTVYPFSTHTLLLRRLFEAAGLDPDRDVRVIVVPPPFTVEALRRGFVDGFCVGSPWNSVAVENGVGAILLLSNQIVPHVPDKVLAVPGEAAEADYVAPLVRALARAAIWCADPANIDALSLLLAEPRHLDLPAALIRRTLDGRMILDGEGRLREDRRFLVLGGDGANRPAAELARWFADAMLRAGQLPSDARDRACAIYRADLFDAALQTL